MPTRFSCHCGKVAGTLESVPTEAMRCNCSICRRKAYLLSFSSPDQFGFHGSRDDVTVYTFGEHSIRHQFCKHCGCAPFGEGTGPDGEAMVAVNLRCAENLDLTAVRINDFDGASL